MKKALILCGLLASGRSAFAQFSGGGMGGGMGGGGAMRESIVSDPAQNERNKRQGNFQDRYGETGSTFIDASVLMNVRADEYVAVFAIAHQEKTASEADAKMNATVAAFKDALKTMGVKSSDIFVDFVLQNRVFTYNIDDKNARAKEELAGLEIKKNISIHFKDKLLLDKMASGAAQLGIYDLVKVDYVIKDTAPIQAQLQAATARILRAKIERYNQFGVKSLVATQIVIDYPSIYYPLSSYKSYQAAQSNSIQIRTDRYTVENALKTSTYYFNPLDGNGFDAVINPVIIEPVVQFTS